MPHPDVRLSAVGQQAGLIDEAQEEPALDVDQDDRKHHPHQGRQQLPPIGDERL